MSVIIDPTNENYAVVDGKLGAAVRLIPAGMIKDTGAPTVAELNRAMGAGTILGYSSGFTPNS